MSASLVFRLHDKAPELVREVLLERGWEEFNKKRREEEDWNLYWRSSAFSNSDYRSLLPWQRLNHHPNTVGITRKDHLARNLRRMRATYGSSLYDFSPTAFILPNDFTRFLSEYWAPRHAGGPPLYWICKPADLSRGRGIFIFSDLKDLAYDCPVVVQRYVSDPLLVCGYKFDLRIYVCVKSFHPLTVYIHQEGLVRFATEPYTLTSLRNRFAHLTNTSINKLGPAYGAEKQGVGPGCKWTLGKFRHFLRSQEVNQLLLWWRINSMVTMTLLAVAPSVPPCPNCVELFGFDVLIDAELKPWLLEVNGSPAMTLDCPADAAVKRGLMGDLIDLMNYTWTDGLREFPKASSVPAKCRETKEPKTSQSLPRLKTLRQSKDTNRRRRAVATAADRQPLPPVHANRACAARKDKTQNNQTPNPTPASRSRSVNRHAGASPRPRDAAGLHLSKVTNHDDTEREEADLTGETGVSMATAHHRQRRTAASRRPAASRKLLNSGRSQGLGAGLTGQQEVAPLRVGDFIRTFPFNAATMKSSQRGLDTRSIVLELHRLGGQLTSGGRRRGRGQGRGRGDPGSEEDTEDQDQFESLFWGPKDPVFLCQCFKTS